MINVGKIYNYLNYLKNIAKNKYYQFYDDFNDFIIRCEEEDPIGLSLIQSGEDEINEELYVCQGKVPPDDEMIEDVGTEDNEEANTDEEEDLEYRQKDFVRKHQFDYDMTTTMIPRFPEANLEKQNKEISFAPGEGKIPTNILKEDDWDVKSFPNLRPTGKNGLHQKRIIKELTYQQYFEQRLKNEDTRFEQCAPFVFAAVAYVEENQLERNIGISGSKGKKVIGEKGERSYTLNDGFAVLDNVKGTPRYWKKAKMEMVAKLENYGPFHIFYTLSCGDMRWNENFSSILRDRGYNIIWNAKNQTLENCTEVIVEVEIEKDGKKNTLELRKFLEEEVDDSLHEFIRTNVFTATRNFVQRVKHFRNEIMMGHNSPMAIKNFSDKLEFQGRGAAHIHGCAWCDLSKVYEVLNLKSNIADNEEEYDSEPEDDN